MIKHNNKSANHNNTTDDRANSRLIITSTDMQKGESVIFDNAYSNLDIDKIVSCAGYPFYGIKWTEQSGRYL
jgi:NTE family protein